MFLVRRPKIRLTKANSERKETKIINSRRDMAFVACTGKGNLALICGVINAPKYANICASVYSKALNECCHFKQDNGPQHTAVTVAVWLLCVDVQRIWTRQKAREQGFRRMPTWLGHYLEHGQDIAMGTPQSFIKVTAKETARCHRRVWTQNIMSFNKGSAIKHASFWLYRTITFLSMTCSLLTVLLICKNVD